MCAHFIMLLYTFLLVSNVDGKDVLPKRSKIKIISESVETDCDHDYVEYFKKVPGQNMLHTFRVVKVAPSFTLSIVMSSIKSHRIMYKINNMDGCQFVNNPLINKVLAGTYNTMIVNNSFFKCPIEPKVYYLKNMENAFMKPLYHPPGHYQLCVRIKMAESPKPFVMQVLWKYRVVKT